jgi:hypothetical protein
MCCKFRCPCISGNPALLPAYIFLIDINSRRIAMTAETNTPAPEKQGRKVIYRNASEAVYGLGLIGALVYYLQHATTFVIGLLGVLKAIVWPAMVVYKLLEFLKM